MLHFLKNLFLLYATRFMFIKMKGPLCMRLRIKGRIYCLSIKLVKDISVVGPTFLINETRSLDFRFYAVGCMSLLRWEDQMDVRDVWIRPHRSA